MPPWRWNDDDPPSSLNEESGVPALKEVRPIAELFAVLSRTFIIGPELGRDWDRCWAGVPDWLDTELLGLGLDLNGVML